MRVGFARVGLPVEDGTPMGGYAFRDGGVDGVLDPLTVSAVTWYDGRHRAALVLTDLVCVNADVVRAARAAVTDVDVLWIAASHTHSGPETGCVPGGAPTPEPWLARLTARVTTAVADARRREVAATGVAYTGPVRGVGSARSQVSGEPTVPLDVVEVRADGRRAGVLAVLPVHPTVLPAGNLSVSADLTGAVRRALARRLGPDVWVAVATGAAGDISTRHVRRGQDTAELARLGDLVAERCLALLAGAGVPAWSADGTVRWRGEPIRLAAKPSGDTGAQVEQASAALSAARDAGDAGAERVAAGNLSGARYVAGLGAGGDVDTEVGAWRIGELALAALPGEPFLALAESVRRGRTGPTAVLGYANGYPGYLPCADAYRTEQYEVLVSAVAAGGGERIAALAADLIATLDRSAT
ncbi:MAG TPA: hypothetical protein VGN37_27775 [Actinocatenispora sp.]